MFSTLVLHSSIVWWGSSFVDEVAPKFSVNFSSFNLHGIFSATKSESPFFETFSSACRGTLSGLKVSSGRSPFSLEISSNLKQFLKFKESVVIS